MMDRELQCGHLVSSCLANGLSSGNTEDSNMVFFRGHTLPVHSTHLKHNFSERNSKPRNHILSQVFQVSLQPAKPVSLQLKLLKQPHRKMEIVGYCDSISRTSYESNEGIKEIQVFSVAGEISIVSHDVCKRHGYFIFLRFVLENQQMPFGHQENIEEKLHGSLMQLCHSW